MTTKSAMLVQHPHHSFSGLQVRDQSAPSTSGSATTKISPLDTTFTPTRDRQTKGAKQMQLFDNSQTCSQTTKLSHSSQAGSVKFKWKNSAFLFKSSFPNAQKAPQLAHLRPFRRPLGGLSGLGRILGLFALSAPHHAPMLLSVDRNP